jgi:hypothetical protein
MTLEHIIWEAWLKDHNQTHVRVTFEILGVDKVTIRFMVDCVPMEFQVEGNQLTMVELVKH